MLVRTMVSQKSKNTEIVVQELNLEGQALEELFVITAISLDMSGVTRNEQETRKESSLKPSEEARPD